MGNFGHCFDEQYVVFIKPAQGDSHDFYNTAVELNWMQAKHEQTAFLYTAQKLI